MFHSDCNSANNLEEYLRNTYVHLIMRYFSSQSCLFDHCGIVKMNLIFGRFMESRILRVCFKVSEAQRSSH